MVCRPMLRVSRVHDGGVREGGCESDGTAMGML